MLTFCKECGNIAYYVSKCLTCLSQDELLKMKNDIDELLDLLEIKEDSNG